MSNQRYFNFPVCLLKNFLTNTRSALDAISGYSLYAESLKEDDDDEITNFITACAFYNIVVEDYPEPQFWRCRRAYQDVEFHAPKVGLNLNIFWDFYNTDKSEFEKVCLLAFLGIKSIIGNKSFCKTDNKYLLSRMNGSARSHSFDQLPDALAKYANEYQVKKIKNELKNNWGLRTYSRYTRGFYVSYTLKLENLMYEAEKSRKKAKAKLQQIEEKALLEKVLKKLAENGH